MRRLAKLTSLFALWLVVGVAFAQNTTVSGTITDSDGTVWANGNITFTLVGTGGPYYCSGTKMTPAQITVPMVLNSSGTFSGSICSNSNVTPVNSQWGITIVSAATAPAQNLTALTVSGASQSLSTYINGAITAIRIPASASGTRAYADIEIISPIGGSTYYNLVTNNLRLYNGTSWVNSTGISLTSPVVAAPSTPATTILQALNNAVNVPVHIVVQGDSYSICDKTNCGVGPTISTNRWPEQLRIKLQTIYGSHGTGMVPIASAFGNTPTLNSEAWSCAGAWAPSGAAGPGNTLDTHGTLILLPAGASCTFHDSRNITWDTLNVYCLTFTNTTDLQVSIDGGAIQHACNFTSGSLTANVVTFPTTISSSHTVVFTSAGNYSFLYAAEGVSGTSGVSIDNVSVGGAFSTDFAQTRSNFFTDIIPGGTQASIVMLMANDVSGSIAVATSAANISTLVTHQQALASAPTVLMSIEPIDVMTGSNPWSAYTAGQLTLASAKNIPVINIQNRGTTVGATLVGWGTTYNSSSGLWDLAGTAWPGGNAGIHPNDKGSLDEGQIIYAALLNPTISTGRTFTASGCSNSALLGGPNAGSFVSGTAGTCTVVLTMQYPSANGWNCHANDLTTNADSASWSQTATTQTTATIAGTTASADIVNFSCIAY